VWTIAGGLLVAALAAPAGFGQPAAPKQAAMTAADMEVFLDGLVGVQIRKEDIAGAVVAIVKDGQVLFAKGYGWADVAGRKPVTVDGTMFRPGSVSKLFTWTAVMQLVEQGKLDLDRDINTYLDFRIPQNSSRPITLRQVMTHTAGFQETLKGLFVRNAGDMRPLRTYLTDHLPPLIFPPGTTPAYSNYGATLAGYAVQRVSGRRFEEYIAENVLKPLGMNRTTFVQPLPADLKPLMSGGYALGSQAAKPFEVVGAFPAGSLSATAADMARFMLAHLQDGALGDARILKPETARLMHSRQFGLDPEMNGTCLGFYEESHNGHRIIGHGGDTVWFHSDLHLMPDAKLGFFYSQNSAGKSTSLRGVIWQAFLDRYFPYQAPPVTAIATAGTDARTVTGAYKVSRRFDTTLLKVMTLGQQIRVSADRDGTVRMVTVREWSGQPKPLREIAPLRYRDAHGEEMVVFRRNAAGNMEAVTDRAVMVFQRVAWYEGQTLNYIVIGFAGSVFGLTLLLWPVAALVRRHYGRKLELDGPDRRWRLLTRIVCAIIAAFPLGLLALGMSVKGPTDIGPHLEPWIHLLQCVGVAGALGALILVYNALRSGFRRGGWWFSRAHDAAMGVAAVGFVWFVLVWHLLDFSTRY
jgi:CubicO group peptidase (beta-lactamase class C family)